MPTSEHLLDQLKRHEGFRKRVYICSAGKETCGYGYNLEANPLNLSSIEISQAHTKGINHVEAERLLKLMITQCRHQLEVTLPFFSKLDTVRQDVLINMCFNIGLAGLLKFKKSLLLIEAGEYSQASIELLNSKWAKDVKGRALELSTQMKKGEYGS
jgi:lysozyme